MAKADPAGITLRRNKRKIGPWHRRSRRFPSIVQYADRAVPSSEYPEWIVSPPLWSARIPPPAVKVLKYTATGCIATEERHSRRDCVRNVGAAPSDRQLRKSPSPPIPRG
jgi:hypothetical protein